MYEEFLLLKDFETFDIQLSVKLDRYKREKLEIDVNIIECRDKLTVKKEEIDAIFSKEKKIFQEFVLLLGEGNKNEEYISRVFKRKIKRSKKSAQKVGENGDSDNESEESVDYLLLDDDDEEDIEDFEEVCPSDCDITLWNKMIDLRELRLDQEDVLSEIQKFIEVLLLLKIRL